MMDSQPESVPAAVGDPGRSPQNLVAHFAEERIVSA